VSPRHAVSDIIAAGVPATPSLRVVVGFNWTAVETADGLGLAATPSKADGARTTPETGSYGGHVLSDLAHLAGAENPYERAIGLAACNAHWNRFRMHPIDAIADGDGLGGEPATDGSTVVIGRFPGLDRKLPGAIVLERNPGPDDLPAEKAPEVIPGCARLIVTATTLVNDTVDALLALAPPGCAITLVGPGTPLCSGLAEIGVRRLAGFVVTDRSGCLTAIGEGAGARAFRKFGRPVVRDLVGGQSGSA